MAYRRIAYAALLGGAVLFQIVFRFYLSTFTLALVLLLPLLSVLLSLGTLAYFKYADFMIRNLNALTGLSVPLLSLALPVGISFYTFQILSYTVDVYRGTVPAQRNLIDLAAYIAMFPQLIAGPIVRYSDIAPELRSRTNTLSDAAAGTRRFVLGLAKKILFANLLGELVSGFRASQEQSVLYFWLGAAAFTLQIYYDFSGYSDMAIGLGRILGFHFPENFRYPYCAGSITEFWRRWHISLGSWFRDYLYIPLGGNRKGKGRQLLNILLVWLATGLWHGADWTFVLWGLLYAALLTAEKLFLLRGLKKLRVLNHIYVLLFVTLGFVLFDADSVRSAAASVCAMFGGGGLPLAGQESLYALRSGAVLLLSAAVGATPLPRRLITAVQQKQAGRAVLAVLEPVGLCLLLAVCTAFLVDGSFNPFLYFRF
jgi:alginate O-acetyltransferase complex protein AlgI